MPGCTKAGDHKAPKDRGLNEYFHFCLEHVSLYNKAWNFFEGMSQADIEDHIKKSVLGERPTWMYASNPDLEDHLRAKAFNFAGENFETSSDRKKQQNEEQERRTFHSSAMQNTPEIQALATLGLEPPVTLEDIKRKYKKLAKQYHPDLNPDDKKAEELLKQVNMSYTLLKAAYQKFDKLEEQ